MARVVITIEDIEAPEGGEGLAVDVKFTPDVPDDESQATLAQGLALDIIDQIVSNSEEVQHVDSKTFEEVVESLTKDEEKAADGLAELERFKPKGEAH